MTRLLRISAGGLFLINTLACAGLIGDGKDPTDTTGNTGTQVVPPTSDTTTSDPPGDCVTCNDMFYGNYTQTNSTDVYEASCAGAWDLFVGIFACLCDGACATDCADYCGGGSLSEACGNCLVAGDGCGYEVYDCLDN